MRKKKKISLVLALSLLVLAGVVFLYGRQLWMEANPKVEEPPVTITVNNEIETSSVDFSQILKNNSIITITEEPASLPESTELDVPFIDQNPQLPTGCEITSLAQVLNFYGFDVDKEYLASNYLPMKEEVEPGCFIEYFLGSPWKTNGSGCFAPAIIITANNYLKDEDSPLTAYSMCYASVNALLGQVAKGYPVIAWTCFDYDINKIEYTPVTLEDGSSFYWPSYEHCVVLSGYDLNTQTVTLTDPTYGVVKQSIEDFTAYYQKFFYQAVVIK